MSFGTCETVKIEDKDSPSGYVVVNKDDASKDAKILTDKQCVALDKKAAGKPEA